MIWRDIVHYLGNDLPTLLHQHSITHMQMQLCHEIGIVQSGSAYLRTGQMHRIHIGNGSDGACASHLKHHLAQYGLLLLCLELIGNSPSGALGRHTQGTLLRQGVYLEHDAVCGHRQIPAFCIPVVYIVINILQGVCQPHLCAYLKSPSRSSLQIGIMTVTGDSLSQQIIEVGIQPTLGHHAAVFTLERTAGSIARIGKERFSLTLTL